MCDNTGCSVHFRNDVVDESLADPYRVTYLDDVAVYSYLEVRKPEGETLKLAIENLALAMALGIRTDESKIEELMLKLPAASISYALQVGHGAISDIMPNGAIPDEAIIEKAEGDRHDIESLHEMMVAKYRK